jgi:acyl-coenzyme A synthetase/AMP-(fatty) acid ligase
MIVERVFHWADQTPDKIAATYNGQDLSFAAFAALIARARGHFARRGWTGEGVAAVAVSNFVDFWVLSLALRSLGLTTIAVDAGMSLEGLTLPDLRCVVTGPGETWPGLEAACATLGAALVEASIAGEAPLDLGAGEAPIRPGGHILLTSGTTGAHKKILMDPAFETAFYVLRRLSNAVDHDSVINCFSFHPRTGVGYKAPVSTWDVGGSVVFDLGRPLQESLRLPGQTHAVLVPTGLDILLALPPGAYPRNPNLRVALTGGTVTQAQLDAAKDRISPLLFNSLSATESHMIGYTPLDTPDDHRWHIPAKGSVVEIVDEADNPAPVGVLGQLRVAAAGGPTGYLHDPETTRAFFRNGFFYPGDLAIRRADGRFALRGRVTEVINLRGNKVSPGPIEDSLRQALGVTGVCLYSMQDAAGDEEIHVVIEAAAPAPMDRLTAALRAELRDVAAVQVRYVTALPRNAMGKVMRDAVRTDAASR